MTSESATNFDLDAYVTLAEGTSFAVVAGTQRLLLRSAAIDLLCSLDEGLPIAQARDIAEVVALYVSDGEAAARRHWENEVREGACVADNTWPLIDALGTSLADMLRAIARGDWDALNRLNNGTQGVDVARLRARSGRD